jgi:type IV secretion system protein VirB4
MKNDSSGLFYRILPWAFITRFAEGVVVQKSDGILQRTFAFRAPDVDSSAAWEVNSLALKVNDFARRLGAGWAFQMEAQRFYTQEYPAAGFNAGDAAMLAPYLIDRERQAAFRAAGRHFESSYFLTFIYKPPAEAVKKITGMFVQSGTSPDGGAKSIKENVDYFINESENVVSILRTYMLLAPLNNEETVAYLHSAVSMNRHPLRFPATSILLDRILPDQELTTSLTMRLGEHYIPIIGVNDFPEETYPAILDGLNRARLEYRWVSRYICLGKEDGQKETQKKEKAHRGNKTTLLQSFFAAASGAPPKNVNHAAEVKEDDSITAGIEIDTDQAALGYYTSCVMVWDRDYVIAKKKADVVKGIINSAGFTCKEETFNALEAFKSMLPGNIYANCRSLPVMTYNLAHAVPLSSVWAGVRSNQFTGEVCGCSLPHIVCSTNEGTPFFLNLNVGQVGHTLILGPTGAGKSTLLNILEMQFFKYTNAQVIVFDKGRSCRGPCLAMGGLFYEPAAENYAGISFQPLRDLDSDTDLLNAIDFIETLFLVHDYPVTPLMRSAIKENLELLRGKPQSQRTLTSFVHYADAFKDPETGRPIFKERLGDYLLEGKYGRIFDAKNSSLSLDTPFLAIETEELMNRGDDCIVPALFYLFSLVEKKFNGRLTLLVLDEAWKFFKNPIFAEKITEWLKVLRKRRVFVILATQDATDVAESTLNSTVIQQCPTKIFLADPSATTASMAKAYAGFNLSEAEILLLASAQTKKDYFYTSEIGRRLFQLDLGPLTLAIIGGADHAALDALLSRAGPGFPLCAAILDALYPDYRQYLLAPDAPPVPDMPAPGLRKEPPPQAEAEEETPQEETAGPAEEKPDSPPTPALQAQAAMQAQAAALPQNSRRAALDPAALLDAVAALPKRKAKDGSGRAAEELALNFGVSEGFIYLVRKILNSADEALISDIKSGRTSISQAGRLIGKTRKEPNTIEFKPPEVRDTDEQIQEEAV